MPISLVGDDKLVVTFRNHAVKNDARSAQEGRPIYDDIEVCDMRMPGARNTAPVAPALEFSHWDIDPITQAIVGRVTYAERFSKQYQQFKARQTQTMHGTPLTEVAFLTEAKRAELRAQNIYTVEQLAHIDGQELKNLGIDGRNWKNRATEYLEEAKVKAPSTQMLVELEALRARNAVLEEDNETMKKRAQSDEGDFFGMSDDALRDYIKTITGQSPKGDLPRKILVRMATDVKPGNNKAA